MFKSRRGVRFTTHESIHESVRAGALYHTRGVRSNTQGGSVDRTYVVACRVTAKGLIGLASLRKRLGEDL